MDARRQLRLLHHHHHRRRRSANGKGYHLPPLSQRADALH